VCRKTAVRVTGIGSFNLTCLWIFGKALNNLLKFGMNMKFSLMNYSEVKLCFEKISGTEYSTAIGRT